MQSLKEIACSFSVLYFLLYCFGEEWLIFNMLFEKSEHGL